MTGAKSMLRNSKPRQRILEAACGLFHKHGLQGASVDKIAEAADSNKMTLYRHFGSKENLAVACLRAVIDEMEAKWRVIETEPDKPDKLTNWIGGMAMSCTGYDDRSELIFAIFRQARGDAVARPLLDAFMAKHRKRVTGLCHAAGVADAETLGTALVALAYGVRANPWGLGGESRRALFAGHAGTLVRLFRSSSAPAHLSKTMSVKMGAARVPGGKRRPPPQAKPRERILAAACALFIKHGVQDANVDEIAAAAASNKMTLYRQFGSKEKLAATCFKSALREAEAMLAEIEARYPGDASCRLAGFIDLIAKALAGTDRRAELIGMAMQAMRSEAVGQAMMREFELKEQKWLTRICRSLGVVEPDVLADIVQLLVHGSDANPWGLGRGELGAQYLSTCGAIVNVFKYQRPAAHRVGKLKRSSE